MFKRTVCVVAVWCLAFAWPVWAQPLTERVEMFDAELSKWEIWIGVPHPTVQDLPPGTPTSKNFHKGQPMGLGNDPKNVFSMIEEDGRPVLKVTGEIYGGLTTRDAYEDYHLSVEFKWGEKKWEPRLNRKRDSGILYHCYGKHGVSANSWKASLEYQVQEKDLGDYIGLGGSKAKARVSRPIRGEKLKYDPQSDDIQLIRYYTQASAEPDYPNGQWNRLDVYIKGDRAVHAVNGEVVFVLFDAIDGKGKPLRRGQIQLQGEGAVCFYRDMVLTPIGEAELPAEVAERLENP